MTAYAVKTEDTSSGKKGMLWQVFILYMIEVRGGGIFIVSSL